MKRRAIWIVAAALSAWATCSSPVCAAGPKDKDKKASPVRRRATNPVGFRVFKWNYQAADGSTKPLATALWYPAARGRKRAAHQYLPGVTGLVVHFANNIG